MKKIDPRLLQSLQQQNERETIPSSIEPIIALDWGEKFCGLAWSPDGIVCLPHGVFPRTQIVDEINNITQKKQPKKIVIGLPISGDGSENHICQKIRNFTKEKITIPVVFCNERGSSQATISPDRSDRIDDLAATHILERYLREQELK